jgi:hypothetical protein
MVIEEEGNDLRAPGHLDQPDTQDDGLEIEICTVCEKSCFVKVKCSMCSESVHEMCSLSLEITSSLEHK